MTGRERANPAISILDKMNSFLTWLAGTFFILIMFLMVREVVGRYFFNSPWVFTQDAATQLLLAATFFGTTYVIKGGGFPVVDLLYSRLTPILKSIVEIVGNLGGLAFLVALAVQVVELDVRAYSLQTKSTTPALLPLVLPYTVMLLGLVFFIIAVIRRSVNVFGSIIHKPGKRSG